MTSFNGPWSEDLDAFKKSVQSMPDQYKTSFASASKDTLERLCDPDVLHVWETDSDIDHLLQLTSVIAKLCNLGTRKEKGANAKDGSMLIIAEEKSGRNNFARICQLVEYLTEANGKKHLEGTVAAFGTIVVVKGWNNGVRSEGRDAEQIVKRINTSIERVFKMGSFTSGKKKIVWHHGPVVHSLLHFINTTTFQIRNSFHAITITGFLDLTTSIKPSPQGKANKPTDIATLESYAKKLDVPVVFLDPASQLITFTYLATYMYYFAYYINAFLPSSLSRTHLHKAQDELVTFTFQLLGASKARYGDKIVAIVKDKLDPRTAKTWARKCVDPASYTKEKCRAAGKEHAIHHAVQLADGPFALLNPGRGLSAFARLSVGPAATDSKTYHIAAPVTLSFPSSRLRPSSPTHTYILLPASSQSLEKVTNRIQGLMMAVLERVRQEKGNPDLGVRQKDMWLAVTRSCGYAIGNAGGKMPGDVEAKVKFVKEKLGKGTWGYAVGASGKGEGCVKGEEGLSEAARANRRAEEVWGRGGNQFGQVQPQQQIGMGGMGGMGQQMGLPMGFGQQPMMGGGQQGLAAPPNSPGMGQAMPIVGDQQMGGFARPQHQGHGQAFASQNQGHGGGGARYPQSFGGNWM